MLLWFATLAILGISWIIRAPQVLAAINPALGVDFFIRNGWRGFVVLGAVFLVVTGREALYADMGHFGRFPIRLAWFALTPQVHPHAIITTPIPGSGQHKHNPANKSICANNVQPAKKPIISVCFIISLAAGV